MLIGNVSIVRHRFSGTRSRTCGLGAAAMAAHEEECDDERLLLLTRQVSPQQAALSWDDLQMYSALRWICGG